MLLPCERGDRTQSPPEEGGLRGFTQSIGEVPNLLSSQFLQYQFLQFRLRIAEKGMLDRRAQTPWVAKPSRIDIRQEPPKQSAYSYPAYSFSERQSAGICDRRCSIAST